MSRNTNCQLSSFLFYLKTCQRLQQCAHWSWKPWSGEKSHAVCSLLLLPRERVQCVMGEKPISSFSTSLCHYSHLNSSSTHFQTPLKVTDFVEQPRPMGLGREFLLKRAFPGFVVCKKSTKTKNKQAKSVCLWLNDGSAKTIHERMILSQRLMQIKFSSV